MKEYLFLWKVGRITKARNIRQQITCWWMSSIFKNPSPGIEQVYTKLILIKILRHESDGKSQSSPFLSHELHKRQRWEFQFSRFFKDISVTLQMVLIDFYRLFICHNLKLYSWFRSIHYSQQCFSVLHSSNTCTEGSYLFILSFYTYLE